MIISDFLSSTFEAITLLLVDLVEVFEHGYNVDRGCYSRCYGY